MTNSFSNIYWWRNDDSVIINFAVDELKSYLDLIGNDHLACQELSDSELKDGMDSIKSLDNFVILVRKQCSQGIKQFYEQLNECQTNLQGTKEDSFIIAVFDSYVILAGQNHRGILYATYSFLENLGVRFFAPQFKFYETHAEFVPRLETVELKETYVLEEPSFDYRRKYIEEGCSHTPANVVQLIDWMAKKKLNTFVFPMDYQGLGAVKWDEWREMLIPELSKRGMLIEVGGHGYGSFLSTEKYKGQHPDWFPDQDEPVQGIQRSNPNVFRFNNKEALETYIHEVIEYLKLRPEISIFDAWPPDHATWSLHDLAPHGGIANAVAYITNHLVERMNQKLPNVIVESIAYIPAADPPEADYMYDQAVLMDLAPYDRSYTQLINDPTSKINTFYNGLLKQWDENGFNGSMCIYEYYTKYSWCSLPVHLLTLMIEEMPHYDRLGVKGFGTYSEPGSWLTYELTHLLVADFSWNVQENGEAYLENYFTSRFGSAATHLRNYYELTEKAGRTIFNSPNGDYSDAHKLNTALNCYAAAKEHLLEGLKQRKDEAVRFMIQRLAWNLDFAITMTEMKMLQLQDQQAAAANKKDRVEYLIHKHCFDGIILKNDFLIRKYNDAIPPGREGKVAMQWIRDMYKDRWR